MGDLPNDFFQNDRFAGSSLRMAAMSLLLHQTMQRAHRHGQARAARERLGHDLAAIFDGAFGGHGAAGGGGLAGVVAGTEGLVHAFREHGLGPQVDSWIGDGPNQPVSPQQVAMVFDMSEVDSMARRAGTDRESLLREVATLVPEFVHRMTPHGALPRSEAEVQGGLGGLLGGLLGQGAEAPPRR